MILSKPILLQLKAISPCLITTCSCEISFSSQQEMLAILQVLECAKKFPQHLLFPDPKRILKVFHYLEYWRNGEFSFTCQAHIHWLGIFPETSVLSIFFFSRSYIVIGGKWTRAINWKCHISNFNLSAPFNLSSSDKL